MLFKRFFCVFLLTCISGISWELPAENPTAPFHFSLGRTQGRGIGYKKNYTTASAQLLPNFSDIYIPFLDLRAHRFDDEKWAANLGIGCRYFSENLSSIFGSYFYYDFRQSQKKNYRQAGIGFEWFFNSIELRLNGYIPLGKTSGSYSNRLFLGFHGHHYLIGQKKEIELGGADIEAGYKFFSGRLGDFYAGIGGYVLSSSSKKTAGVQGCVSAHFLRYFTLDLKGSHDSLFHSRFQGKLTFSIPLGGKSKDGSEEYFSFTKKIHQPVQRREIIALDKKSRTWSANDPSEGNTPLNFIFVDNSLKEEGKGTFESPYNSLSLAENNSKTEDILYVYAGDGTSKGMDQGIVLKDQQRLLGSGVPQLISSNEGIIFIPSTPAKPLISNLNGNAIKLANDNEIAGFKLMAKEWGIYGDGVQNTLLANNQIEGLLKTGGIGLMNASGKLIINHNLLNGTQGEHNFGIYADAGGTSVCETILEGNSLSSFYQGVNLTSKDSAALTSVVARNKLFLCSDGGGVQIAAKNESAHHSTVVFNSIYSNNGNGITVQNQGKLTANIFHNQASNNLNVGIAISNLEGLLRTRVCNNHLYDNWNSSFFANTSGRLELKLDSNTGNGSFVLQKGLAGEFIIEEPQDNQAVLQIPSDVVKVPLGSFFNISD